MRLCESTNRNAVATVMMIKLLGNKPIGPREPARADKASKNFIIYCDKAFMSIKQPLSGLLTCLLPLLSSKKLFLEVHVINRVPMRKVNRLLRGKDQATNVVSVVAAPFVRPGRREVMLGELYLCPSVISARKENLVFLVIHGLLHVHGYTHESSHDTLLMKEREMELAALVERKIPKISSRLSVSLTEDR